MKSRMTKSGKTPNIIFCFALLAVSCGLPTIIYLYPPKDFSSSGTSQLSLQHDIANYEPTEGAFQSFKGYEIYYRVYDAQTTADSDLSKLTVKASSTDSNGIGPSQFMDYAEGLGFVRLRDNATNTPPLIGIQNPSQDVSYYINLNAAGSDWTLTNSRDSATSMLVRNIVRPDVSFSDLEGYLEGDADYAGTTNSPSGVYLVFFAVAYGNDPAEPWILVYSTPDLNSESMAYGNP